LKARDLMGEPGKKKEKKIRLVTEAHSFHISGGWKKGRKDGHTLVGEDYS